LANVLLRSHGGFLLVTDSHLAEELCVVGFNCLDLGLGHTELIGSEGETLHGTQCSVGVETDSNPLAAIFATSKALEKRGKLDKN
jgi:hypothetical protein